jgi:SlyX protein
MNEQRLIDLEIKFSHQENVIEELHRAHYKNLTAIENLEKSLKLLTERFEAATSGSDVGPANEKPPHY